ncbi:unnamed protein product [Camellia sinensis]
MYIYIYICIKTRNFHSLKPFINTLLSPTSIFIILLYPQMAQQKVVLKIMTMTDEKTKQKAIEAVADIYGVNSIAADLKDQKMTIIGEMDAIAIAKKLKKIGKIDIVSVGPAKEEKKDEKKGEKKDEKK